MSNLSARENLALVDAMLLWNDNYGVYFDGSNNEPSTPADPVVVTYAAPSDRDVAEYDNSVGACFDNWRGLFQAERLNRLLRDA